MQNKKRTVCFIQIVRLVFIADIIERMYYSLSFFALSAVSFAVIAIA